MLVSILYGLLFSILILGPYFAYQILIKKNPYPLHNPPSRNRPTYRKLDQIVASRSPEVITLHKRVILYWEIASLFAVVGIITAFTSGARSDIYAAVVGWSIAGISGAVSQFLSGFDAIRMEVAYRKRRLFSISPFVYLAEGRDARFHGVWMYFRAGFTLIFTVVTSVLIIMFVSGK